MAQFDPSKAVALDPGFENTGDVFVSNDLTPEEVKQAQAVLGSGARPASKFNPALAQPVQEKPVESSGGLWSHIKPAILPTLGGIAGAGLGTVVGGPTVVGLPASVIGLEMAGAGAGEKLNQVFGITEPSNTAVATSALSAPIGRGLGAAGKFALNTAVKSFAGRDIMSEGAQSLLTKWLAPKPASGQLFKDAEQMGFAATATNTLNKIDDVLVKEAQRAATPIRDEIIAAVTPLRNFFVGRGGAKAVLVPELMEEEQRLALIAKRAYDGGNYKLGNSISGIRSAILDDLEQSGAGVVREASKAYRKEKALEDLSTLLAKPHPVQQIKDFAKDNPLFRGAFPAQADKDQIMRIAEKLTYLSPSGSSGPIGKMITATAGSILGGIPGGILGWFGPDVIKSLLRTPFGRNYTERILSASYGRGITEETAAALATFARGMTGKPPQENAESTR